jgi:hypothetical protein
MVKDPSVVLSSEFLGIPTTDRLQRLRRQEKTLNNRFTLDQAGKHVVSINVRAEGWLRVNISLDTLSFQFW